MVDEGDVREEDKEKKNYNSWNIDLEDKDQRKDERNVNSRGWR